MKKTMHKDNNYNEAYLYAEIKEKLVNNEINRRVKTYSINRGDLKTYYNVGKLLDSAGRHYGEGIIKKYSDKLQMEIGKSYSTRTLYKMLKYYKFVESQKVPTLSAKLSWSHFDELLRFDDINKINYYVYICESQNLSVRQLREIIKSKEYERLPENTKKSIIKRESSSIIDFVKNPIIINNNDNYEVISEKVLQKLILEDLSNFLEELGEGFTFLKNEYKIKLGNRYNYIDLLLFNIKYNCYVVVELKVTELKKEHIGQIQVYMNYIDENIKTINHNETIGIIICKEDNNYVIKYCSDNRIIARKYAIL